MSFRVPRSRQRRTIVTVAGYSVVKPTWSKPTYPTVHQYSSSDSPKSSPSLNEISSSCHACQPISRTAFRTRHFSSTTWNSATTSDGIPRLCTTSATSSSEKPPNSSSENHELTRARDASCVRATRFPNKFLISGTPWKRRRDSPSSAYSSISSRISGVEK